MTTALYRRYRPETFGEMIGQSQVTDPLMTALRGDRVGHAYLFSGPRGCGKTTSARILARCLNCAEGPTDTPCGVCDSCVELSRNGGGSLDVVEIDAASHNGVDDARDLRERATFAPSRDRFKIFILDEAHMVTPQGFNALLKLVEEPPAHVKFIFATTEPEKVLGTIRSRTHHYPFRLVPPAAMLEYVEKLAGEEGVQVEQGVLPLVVRAGGGSPRDTLSLLDQLIAGSEPASGSATATVSYERAVALLGYTHAELLDEIVEALSAADAAAAFPAVDRVVQTGQDPRRFVDDLLERLRDLIVIAAVGDGASAVLRGIPADELQRMRAQAAGFGAARLSRTADLVSEALDDMTGATSPRLHLELMVARVLAGAGRDAASPAVQPGAPAAAPVKATPAAAPAPAAPVASATPATPAPAAAAPAPAAERAPGASAPASAQQAPAPAPSGPVDFARITAAWPAILTRIEGISRGSWIVVTGLQPLDYDTASEVLTLGFSSPSDVARFKGATPGQGTSDHLRTAIEQELGVTVKYRPAPLPPSGGGEGGTAPKPPAPSGPASPGATPSAPATPAKSTGTSDAASPASSDDAPAAGWANPMQSPSGSDAPTKTQDQQPQQAQEPQKAQQPQQSQQAQQRVQKEQKAPTPRAYSAPVTEWAVAPIPTSAPTATTPQPQFPVDDEPAEVEAAAGAPKPPVDGLVESRTPSVPFDDAPPYDDEPPYDPEYDSAPPEPAGRPGSSRPASAQPAGSPRAAGTRQTPAPAASPRAEAPHATAPAAASAPGTNQASSPARNQAAAAPVTSSRSAAPGGVQRYGEAVVRQVLGATFVREEPYEPPTRFN